MKDESSSLVLLTLWHGRHGHVNFSYIEKMWELDMLSSMSLSNDKCDLCAQSKFTKETFKPVLIKEIEFSQFSSQWCIKK